MAYVEPMDVDHIGNDFEDKENSFHNSNVLPRTPCTEKGYEELDVSELNMKLRYSITPASSPMSNSFTANFKENKFVNQEDKQNTIIINENCNLSRSLNSTLTKSDPVSKSPKLPLQEMSSDQLFNSTMTSSIRRSLDTDTNNCTITLNGPDNIDENLSLPSTSSSSVHTPDAITPTKDISKGDGGSPIMRGLKSVLNMFRSSQSPIPPEEVSGKDADSLEPVTKDNFIPPITLASTPINTNKNKECNSSKRNSPLKDSVIFNDDLEKELQWKEETTIIFKQEKIPIQKLLFQQPNPTSEQKTPLIVNDNMKSAVEYMDISYNESGLVDKTMTDIENRTMSKIVEAPSGMDSDSEFVDCETTYTRNDEQSTSEVSALHSDNKNNNNHNINSEAIGEIVVEEDITLAEGEVSCINQVADNNDNDLKTKEFNDTFENSVSQANIILTDMLNGNNDEVIKTNGDENNLTDGNRISCDVSLNVTDNASVLPEVENKIPLNVNVDKNIQLQSNGNSEINSNQESHIVEPTNANVQEIKPETEVCNPNDVTKPLNIITEYPNNENTNNSDIYSVGKNDNDIDSLQNLGLLKRYDIEGNVSRTDIIPNNCSKEIADVTINDNNIIDSSVNVTHINNETISLGSTDSNANTMLPNIEEKALKNDLLDINNENISETNKKEPTDKTTSIVLNNHNNNYAPIPDVNLSFDKSMCLDVTFNNVDNECIDTDKSNDVNIYVNSEEKMSEEMQKRQQVQESLSDEVNTPSDCPLPLDDDVDSHSLKENFDIELNNSVIDSKNPKDVSKEKSNMTFEDVHVDKEDVSNINTEVIVSNQEMADVSFNKTVEITDCTEAFKCEISPNHPIILTDDNTTLVINNYNDNVQSEHVSSHIEEDIEKIKIIDNEVASPPNTILCNDEIIKIQNNIELENIENPFATKAKLQESPPISPKINRGYNINFDEIDDPFATKTNIRTSPPPETSTMNATINHSQKKIEQKRIQIENRRKSQPERKKQSSNKKPFNKSFESALKKCKNDESINESSTKLYEDIKINKPNVSLHEKCKEEVEAPKAHDILKDYKDDEVVSQSEEKFIVNELENCNTKANEAAEIECSKNSSMTIVNKSVFNLPEIDDINFNPFSTKTKIRQSPSPSDQTSQVLSDEAENQSQLVNDGTINIEKAIQEKYLSPSGSSTGSSKNDTTQEVKTEDEDTIEGPFFEADELAEEEKLSEFEFNKDDVPFEDFPVESNTDKKEELFIDAEAFEFLLNQNKSNVVADSGKESLFLKFDPLFAKRVSSDGVLSALNRIQKRQTTPIKCNKVNETIEPAAASTSTRNVSEEIIDETNIMTSKPMMVVNPAVNSLVSPRKSMTPPRINRRSLTFTSPAMAVIDRLLSLSGNTSLLDHDTSMPQPTRECNDTDIALTQLRELLAEKEIHVHNLRSETKELKERLAAMESQVRTLEKETEGKLKKINDLNDRLAEKTKINKSMAIVVEEYERTIASLISDMDQEKRRNAEERAMLISERDEQTAHLASMEVSFSDLHSKYEKTKHIILSMKANEDTYKKSIKDFEDNLLKMQNNYELLKQHATSKLNHANQELEKFNRSHEAEVLKLNAMIKRKELHITSLEESLAQKTKANEELTAICDELINKVG